MDLVVFSPSELRSVLGALRTVVEADGAVTEPERALVLAVARLHRREIAWAEVAPSLPSEVAGVILDPHRRKRAVQLAIVAALASGRPSEARERAVADLARALAIPEGGLEVLHDLAHGHALFARFDVARRMRRFLADHDKTVDVTTFARFFGLTEDRELAARYRALAEFPEGSLGRAFYDQYVTNGFGFPGEQGSINEDFLFHDVGHLLAGYGTDPEGEIQQAAFQAGFTRKDGFLFLLFGILQFHLGLRLTPAAKPEVGYFDPDAVLRAAARGAACTVDLSDHFAFWDWAPLPLAEVRRRCGVPPM